MAFLTWADTKEIPASCLEQTAMMWLADTRGQIAPATLRRRLASLREFGYWAGFDALLYRYKTPPIPKAVPHPLPEGIDGIVAMMEAGDHPLDAPLVALCGFQGLRVNEAVTAKTGALDLAMKTLLIRGKGGRERLIPLTPMGRKPLLRAYLMADDPHARFVPRSDSWARARLTELGRRAGLSRPVASHDLRATFATGLYGATRDLLLVQQFLGHAHAKTTEVYTLVDLDQMRAGAAKLTPDENATVLRLVTADNDGEAA